MGSAGPTGVARPDPARAVRTRRRVQPVAGRSHLGLERARAGAAGQSLGSGRGPRRPKPAVAPTGASAPGGSGCSGGCAQRRLRRGGRSCTPTRARAVTSIRPTPAIAGSAGSPIPPQEGFAAPRPSLGVLRLSTGDTVPLDRDIVLGRAPFHADENAASRPHLVQLASPGNDISRSHVRVSLENWFVQVTDLGSTNGTVVTLPGQPPVRLRPHDPFTILPGTSVSIADEITLRYEASA